ncbi:MAG: GTP 3',8-cyclase MoaA [Opitutales bacterium]|nr:GTP 3',8-cyclase MoaA [Opitutales bacterium]
MIRDRLNRPLFDLRLSLIDRCNLRCRYCMPEEVFGPDYAFLPKERLLTPAALERAVRAFVSLGVRKVRLTGGEPLLRPEAVDIVARLARVEGLVDLAMTTNATRLARLAAPLAAAGLRRVNASLDALDPVVFRKMSGGRGHPSRVLEGIDAARAAGLDVKVNTVIRRDLNDSEIEPLADHFRRAGITLRFIEYMDTGNHHGWDHSLTVPAAEILERIGRLHPLEPLPPSAPGEVARRHRYNGLPVEAGVITSITQPFCRDCGRARLSADGRLFTCLFATRGHDLLELLDSRAPVARIAERIREVWGAREDRYSELRASQSEPRDKKVEMSYIGG